MTACEACHIAKVRCDQQQPCSRCDRLKLQCVARISRQGQGPKKRKNRHKKDVAETAISAAEAEECTGGGDGLATSEDGCLIRQCEKLGKYHYGVQHLIRSWVSFAFTRRSFSLLSRASRLAARCGVSMDEIFCNRRREIMDPIMLFSAHEQQQQIRDVSPLQWSDLPVALAEVCAVADESSSRSKRHIMVRESKNGHSRYLLSDAFQQDIASLWLIEETWKANERSVIHVFLEGPKDFEKFTKAVGYQVSRYTQPDRKPECARVNSLQVKMLPRSGAREMDLISSLEILSLEHSFFVSEFVAPKREIQTSVDAAQQKEVTDPLLLFNDLDALVVDNDLEMFLSLMNDG